MVHITAAEEYFLKTKFFLADGSTKTRTQIRRAEYERVEAGGAAIRNGTFAAGGALLYSALGKDAMRGAQVWSVLDGAAMFAAGNAGAPYGKVSPVSQLNKPSFTMEQRPLMEIFNRFQ